jgi:FkbH-like protein
MIMKYPSFKDINTCPVSMIQLQFWVIHEIEPELPGYNIPSVCAIEGEVNTAALDTAVNALMERYPIFRAVFSMDNSGIVVQQALPWQKVALPLVDLRSPDGFAADVNVINQAALEEIRKPFDLTVGPPIRFRLYQCDERSYRLVITAHHIVFDLVTKDLFAQELEREYRLALSGKAEPELAQSADYAVYSVWQKDWMKSDACKKMEEAWRRYLDGTQPVLNIPVDRVPENASIQKGAYPPILVELSNELLEKIKAFCRNENLTPFLVLLTAWALTLARYSAQTNLCVGIPMTNRRTDDFKNTMGCFVNSLPLPFDISDNPTLLEALRRVRMGILQMHRIQEMPYYHLVQLMRSEGIIGGNSLYQAGFTFEHPMRLHLDGLEVKPVYIQHGTAQIDLFATFWQESDSIIGVIKYDNSRFNAGTIELIKDHMLDVTAEICERPEQNTNLVTLIPVKDDTRREKGLIIDKPAAQENAAPDEAIPVMAIAASFTSEVMQEFLEFWFEKLGQRIDVRFASFNQVFQELLTPSGLLRSNRNGNNIIMVRIDDLLDAGNQVPSNRANGKAARLEAVLDELLHAVTAAAQSMQVPLCFVLCPSSPAGEEITRLEKTAVEGFLEALRVVPGVTVLTHEDVSRHYPVSEYYEPFGETLGKVPFTRPYFAALATAVVRALNVLFIKPIKAFVVDCDGTLWSGVSAEDGATGVTIGPVQQDFQRFLIEQYQSGVVLCLCSKNQASDVWAVFDRHPDMLLKREHFTFWKINWEPKSSNIQNLAREINIGLDAMAFLDDNPLERAEVSAGCPSVLCVEFPDEWDKRTPWLENLWALDHGRVTAEDRKRQDHYRSEQLRENIKKSAGSIQDFLEKLELKIDLHPAEPDDYERLGQLSVRTNQFNTTTLRLTTREVVDYAETPGMSAHIARVSDRFGDYGLVGGMLVRAVDDILRVEGMFLSCRALGRGVEYKIAAYVGAIAHQAGCSGVAFPLLTTDRNEPARNFLSQVARLCNGTVGGDGTVIVATDHLSVIRYEPVQVQDEGEESETLQKTQDSPVNAVPRNRELYFSIASELGSVDTILKAVEQRTRKRQCRHITKVPTGQAALPKTETERMISEIWKRVLGLSEVNTHAKFFELGGTSLLMVRIAVELKRSHDLEVSILDMFQYPTVADLARYLDGKGDAVKTQGQKSAEDSAFRQRKTLSTGNLPESFKRLKKSRV